MNYTKQINEITVRIHEVNDRIDGTINTSEINKLEKTKKKLVKKRNKLYDKLKEEMNESNVYD